MVRALEAATRFRNRSSSIAQAVAAEREAELQREEAPTSSPFIAEKPPPPIQVA